MNCNEAAPFISALFDGERIPRETAGHLAACPDCCARLSDYVQMSVELKRIASETAPENVPTVSWGEQSSMKWKLWQFGREQMRISRFALALMIVAIATLSAGLMLVRARDIWWFQMAIQFPNGGDITQVFQSSELQTKPREAVQHMTGSNLAYAIRLIDWKQGSVELGIRAQKFPEGLNSQSMLEQVRNAPEQINWFGQDRKLPIHVEGYEAFEITGELLTKAPDDFPSLETYLPKPGELRLSSPVLLRNGRVVGDLNGATAYAGSGWVDAYYVPHEGVFLFSAEPFKGAIRGKVQGSQVQFSSDGQSYQLLTGAPMVALEVCNGRLWVAHYKKTLYFSGDKTEKLAVFTLRVGEISSFLKE